MAIYDIDAIMEHSEDISGSDKDSILDNMLEACDSMMESICKLDEGARMRYINRLKKQTNSDYEAFKTERDDFLSNYDEKKDNKERAKKVADYESKFIDSKDKLDKARGGSFVKDPSWYGRPVTPHGDSEAEKRAAARARERRLSQARENKENWKKETSGPAGDDYVSRKIAGDSKHNKEVIKDHMAKKKAIKETCLTILSVLDEI